MSAKQQVLNQIKARQIARAGKKHRKRLSRPPRWLYPLAAEREYERQVFAICKTIEDQVKAMILPVLPDIIRDFTQDRPTADSARLDNRFPRLVTLFTSFGMSVRERMPKPAEIGLTIARLVATFNKGQLSRIMKAVLAVDVFTHEPWLSDKLQVFAHDNARLITKMTDDALSEIEGTIMRGVQSGRRAEDIAKELKGRYGVTRNRARLIARDQVGKLNGNLTELRQSDLGVTDYIWRTSQDERVRPSHQSKEGQGFKWKEAPADTGHPGHDIRCRCYAEPVLDVFLDDTKKT